MFFLLILASCSPTRKLQDGQVLLNKTRIQLEDSEVGRRELNTYVRQQPNRRILGVFRFHLGAYNLASRRTRETRFRSWIKNTIGEPPVIYDEGLTQASISQFELFMHSRGYFDAEIDYSVNIAKKRASVTYKVTGNQPYIFEQIIYNISDPFLELFIREDSINTLIETGDKYNERILREERERITRGLKNNGFFAFNRDFIVFEVDSTIGNNNLKLDMIVSNPVKSISGYRDSVLTIRHKRYMINEVKVLPEFSPLRTAVQRNDTLHFFRQRNNPDSIASHTYLFNDDVRIRPAVISNHILLWPGSYYNIRDVEQSFHFLAGLRNFRFTNIQFQEAQSDLIGTPNDTLAFLNAEVQLNRSAANAFSVEAEGLNSEGNLGIASNLLFQNRNLFRGAEIFHIRLKGALEASSVFEGDDTFDRLPFNTLEFGVETGIDFPRLLLPLANERLSRNARPKSTVVSGANYRQRPDYTRFVLNLSYGFEWNETRQKRHFVYPIEISSIRVFNDEKLRANIPNANPFILSRFSDHLILGAKYTFLNNQQRAGVDENFYFLRTNIESAGNILNVLAENLEFDTNELNSYTLFNIPFAQYIKADVDFRYYHYFSEDQILVGRINAAAGIPYGNIEVLPFVKSYFVGGANSMRAWSIYSLGPGSYASQEVARFDRYGDIKLESNLEYRFPMFSFWHGAFFLDVGNVWFLNENIQFPGGEFKLNSFYRELAVGGGFGLRMDLDFFVLRIDAGLPLRNPSLPAQSRWISSWPGIRDFNANLGIGFPF